MEIHQDSVPLRVDESGEVRVGKTRVIYKLVIEAFEDGASPEEIAEKMYTTLTVPDVYGAIAYYLRHKDDVKEYMRQWDEEADKMQALVEAQPGYQEWKEDLKQRLLKRKAQLDRTNAATRQ